MEILVAILIYIGVLNAGQQYTTQEIYMLEMQHLEEVEKCRKSGDFTDSPATAGKTVWDHEEL